MFIDPYSHIQSASGLGLVSPFTNVRAMAIRVYASESLPSCHITRYTRVPTRAKEDDQHLVAWYLLSSDEDYYDATLNRSFAQCFRNDLEVCLR